jgi:hypothetical protein
MKLIRASALASLITAVASAQTNTFPASGNVGIGTTNPAATLHLANSQAAILSLEKAGTNTASIFNDGSLHIKSGSGVTYHDSNYHIFSNFSGTEQLRIEPSGYVGIGSSNPTERLTVNGNINADSLNATGGVQQFYANGGVYLAGHSSSPYAALQAYSNNAGAGKSLALNPSGGNVGIGTSNPSATLDVNGDISLPNHSGKKQIYTWSPADPNWRIGMNTDPGFTRSLTNIHVQYLTYGSNPGQGFAIGVNGGESSFEVAGDHKAYFRGNVGIGTTNSPHKLAVNGTIKAKEVIVETTGWSDYVFADDYALQPLSQVEAHIKEHKHLPGIPSASAVATNGVNVGDMQAALLAKVEELTLHLIAQEKELTRLRETEKDVAALRAEVRQLRQTK